ncbi:unnamed protein product [Schistocephalus solidus]|uniref:T-box domain-containing protein n=1 Tax=Schistocephalus solidus TaxID=70667 RepID=A0A183T8S0_SCHSO|nr:unnamed protein product [Schistocephalus solidus]
MFPVVRVSFTGLKPATKYLVLMDIVPVDSKRYRYAYHRSSWLVAGKADPDVQQRCYVHPDAPFLGDQLSKQAISFEKLKLTNNIILNSMHKYQPRIHLIKRSAVEPFLATPPQSLNSIRSDEIKTFEFPETVFIAVTAYQNQLVSVSPLKTTNSINQTNLLVANGQYGILGKILPFATPLPLLWASIAFELSAFTGFRRHTCTSQSANCRPPCPIPAANTDVLCLA